ncbi:MAG: PHP domain-containing protein [Desulfobacterales bacterium]|nr:MAG: PHP domain-containing protein [Desulfobacterales bacterium]
MNIDLHIHSTASDGSLSPIEILNLAIDLNLGAIAITDHDTIDGSRDAVCHGIPPSLEFLTGVEISADPPPSFPFSGSMHILGYAIDLDNSLLNKTLLLLQESRKHRNPRILELLSNLGIELTLDEVRNEAGECQLGRPHIAQHMITKGFVKSMEEAFKKYLGTGKPAYVDKYRVGCAKAIEIIIDAGGIPVLAHPYLLPIKNEKRLEALVITLKEMGLKGLETYYPEHSPRLISQYNEMANRHNLLITGGTDFHGSIKPEIKMGSGTGDLYIPYQLYENLMSSLERTTDGTN